MKKNKISKNWINKQRRDIYVRKSKIEGYRSRAVYKLEEINNKFKLTEKKNFNFKKLSKLKNILILTDLKNSKKINNKKLISKNTKFDFQKIMSNFFVTKKKIKFISPQ